MIVLNDYFHNEKKASNGSISVSGKLEAYIGNYFVSGEGILDETQNVPDFISDIVWIRDDFLSDENIDFDYDAFEKIDSGIDYINPDHFSVNEIIYSVRKTRMNL